MAFAEMQVGDQTIKHDHDSTQRKYRHLGKGGADECGCTYCQNYAVQRDSIFPESFKELLAQLGIDLAKEGEVYAVESASQENLVYGGWFHFTGEMIAAGERNMQSNGFEYWFTSKCPNAPTFRDEPMLAVEFVTVLKWVLTVRPE